MLLYQIKHPGNLADGNTLCQKRTVPSKERPHFCQLHTCRRNQPRTGQSAERIARHIRELSPQERAAAIEKNPLYGRVICRCETITESEIVDALHAPIPPVSIDGVKRRCGAGMGRCQGGFCGPRVHEIIARELGLSMLEIPKDRLKTRYIPFRS